MLNDSTYRLFEQQNLLPFTDSLAVGCPSASAFLPGGGLEEVPIPSLPQTESWVFAVLSGLFVLFIFATRAYPGLISEDLFSIFRVKERSSIFSNPEGNDSRLRVLYVIFSFCTLSLYAYVSIFTPGHGAFSLPTYAGFLLATTLFFLVKGAFIRLLCYIFFNGKILALTIRSYYNLIIFLSLLLFPLLTIRIYASAPIAHIVQIVGLTACLTTAILVILKLFQIFFSKLLDSFYILLYLCTLEILPVLALFHVYRLIV